MPKASSATLPDCPPLDHSKLTADPTAMSLPAAAFRLERAALQFAKPEASEPNSPPAPVPFSMLARTGNPIDHWYWGQIIHDMAGFTARKDTIAVDYCHDQYDVLGFGDKQDATPDGLMISGKLTPFTATDRASEVVHKSAAGVPYEASISFDYSSVEFLQQNATAEVNGQTITGPAYIVRQWTLVGVAVCIYGADGATSTSFAASENQTRSVTLFSKSGEPIMSTAVTAPAPATEATKTTPAELSADQVKANLTASLKAELKRFTAKFGEANGANWFSQDKTYEEALELHIDAQSAAIAKLTADLEAANTKLANAPKGEPTALSTSDAEKPKTGTTAGGKALSKIGQFAANLKLPGDKPKAA